MAGRGGLGSHGLGENAGDEVENVWVTDVCQAGLPTHPETLDILTREGIHCDFCHKIDGTDAAGHPEFLGLEHGRDALRLVRPAGSVV